MLDKIFDFIKKYWWLILLVVVLCLAVFAPAVLASIWTWITTVAWPAIASVAGLLPWWGWAAIAFGLAYLIDPAGTTATVTNVARWVGDVVGDTLGAVAGGLVKSTGGLIVAGLALWWFFARDKDEESVVAERNEAETADPPEASPELPSESTSSTQPTVLAGGSYA